MHVESLQQLQNLRRVVGELFGSEEKEEGASGLPSGAEPVSSLEEMALVAAMINGL
jgi:hypothetical protein